MAEIKREIRTLGQRVSGLTAGNTYTFVLKRPNVRVDVYNALASLDIAQELHTTVSKLLADLERIRSDAMLGNASSAREALTAMKKSVRTISSRVADAQEFAVRAEEDAKDAHADVKDAYNAAKDGAAQAVASVQTLMTGVDDVFKAINSVITEAEIASAQPSETNH